VRVALMTEQSGKIRSPGITVRPEENMASRLFSDTDLAPEELQRHILSTYMNIRVGIAVIGIVFPFVLWLGGYVYARLPLQGSMSAYYHAVGYEG